MRREQRVPRKQKATARAVEFRAEQAVLGFALDHADLFWHELTDLQPSDFHDLHRPIFRILQEIADENPSLISAANVADRLDLADRPYVSSLLDPLVIRGTFAEQQRNFENYLSQIKTARALRMMNEPFESLKMR